MMIALKYAKNGNSLCINLPKDAVRELDAKVGETVYMTKDADGNAKLTPYNQQFDAQVEIARKGMRKYRNALRTLAKR